MNSAAILASVDQLLEGMPRHVLDDALARMSGQLGLPASGFEGVLAMLRGSVVGTNTVSNQNLLGMLSASANGAANPALSAESADGTEAFESLEKLFTKFLGGKEGKLSADASLEDVANEFVSWLKETGKSHNIKGLGADMEKFGDALFAETSKTGANIFGSSEAKNQAFSEILKNLENTLQSSIQREGAGDALSGNGQNQTTAFTQPNSAHAGQTANVQNTHASSVSTMLQQMENIERLSEAMKMAAKGGVNNITMQLAPAELGRLMLRVESKNGVVSAKLKVEKREAAEQLGAGLKQLKENLRALGIELGDVEIEHAPPPDAPDLLAELTREEEPEPLKNLFA
jgi:flagellar hook-length control protein FliK